MLVCENISLHIGKTILKNVDFSIKKGEIIGIVGKSGAGKTSFLKIVSGLIEPTSGTVKFHNNKVVGPNENLIPGHSEIQLVNQDFSLDLYHTVEENIKEKILYLPKKERDSLVYELLELLELTDFKDQKAFTISGGEQQRLAIARALACEPQLILLDEPFAHLDARLKSKLTNYFLMLRDIRQTSIILVSHDGSEVLSLADKIFIFKKGEIRRSGKPLKMYYNTRNKEDAQLFGEVNSVQLGNKRILFRPDEYKIESKKGDDTMEIEFSHSLFTGPMLENYFLTKAKEKIVLYSLEQINHVRFIRTNKRQN